MFKMIKEYFAMKAMEIKMKSMFYSFALKVIEENKDIISLMVKLQEAFKGATPEEIRKELIHEIAHFAHEQAVKEREAMKEFSEV